MKLCGAAILIECLIEQGVQTLFGFPGGAVLPIYDELYKREDRISHILTAHEQHAGHAADGYARATGRTGVCLATSGPGATNLVTAIATAYMDSSPVVFLTGNVPQQLMGTDSFQEADILGITMSITKHSWLVTDVRKLAQTVREAFFIAKSGRPGPVLIDIPKDVQIAECEYEPASGQALIPNYSPDHPALQLQPYGKQLEEYKRRVTPYLERACELIQAAQRPLIYAGGGVTDAASELKALSERMDAPVANTLMGLGTIDPQSPMSLGMVGMHGTHAANIAMQRCDLLLAVGVRFSDRALGNAEAFAPGAKVIHIDLDRAEINKNVSTTLHITGHARVVLELLCERLPAQHHADWVRQAGSMRENYLQNDLFEPRNVLHALHEAAGDMTVATDVGQHQMWTAQHFPFSRPRQLITSGGLGTMGFGFGAAIGASVGTGKPVVLVTGDGSFRMNLTELSTAQHYGVPVIIVLFNNGTLGMVRQWQTLFFSKHYSQTTLDRGPDFMKLAEAYGLAGWRVQTLDAFRQAIAQALDAGRPCIVECMLGIDEMVAPMVAPGAPIDSFCLN
ncbi:MAG TPA: biosynthetic-type acetolactate synthase large subunit [Candidatus Onthenecus intestinigallinarum]|uniref:Acetolactate synthase n=1 Tax=Candidatus Onthenecus intestinigallinarum TaxID=2840875 RepID=A0A9D0Z9N9_9FIRM|nr:biosynthetic-type acetolactate synthase large subunit [Candidatus Onthenecus intestinigallinarum]